MSFYGRGGTAGGSPMNWYNTQKSEFLIEVNNRELRQNLKWFSQNEGVTLPGGGVGGVGTADDPGATGLSVGSTVGSMLGSPDTTGSVGSLTARPHLTYMVGMFRPPR